MRLFETVRIRNCPPLSARKRFTLEDVLAVRTILNAETSIKLPVELVLYIMELAEYRLTVTVEHKPERRISARGDNAFCTARLALVTPPMPVGVEGEFWRAWKVTFEFDGHDQGWGGEAPGA